MKALVAVAAVLGFVLATTGAVGAHMLAAPEGAGVEATWDAAMLYGFVHVLATLAACALPLGRLRLASGWLFLGGVVFFSLTLLVRTVLRLQTGGDPLGAVGFLAPVGGVSYMAGWVTLAFAALAHRPSVVIGDKP